MATMDEDDVQMDIEEPAGEDVASAVDSAAPEVKEKGLLLFRV